MIEHRLVQIGYDIAGVGVQMSNQYARDDTASRCSFQDRHRGKRCDTDRHITWKYANDSSDGVALVPD